ncbi:selenide, water dikinase SelD [Exilibacterium tricleocarpae]|uniref:Selenide, water dikinase SelD n=1 Tax=Exilibacterium tricleocarpae TaxID=2591008 RepID=A0A545TFR3_9GAMM|nr:selenide, water dikinase SelD [Exilibacterium tricleocarpae]TQV76021.1 selenide, water dikinase SelD [Exilibacterium tricleocarpae]
MHASTADPIIDKDIILIGGGHSHALVLRRWAMRPTPGVRLTLVSPQVTTPYSGMLPGLVAGHYDSADLHIDLLNLCRLARVRFIQATVTRLDLERKRVLLSDRPALEADLVAINCGITPNLSVPGAREHSTPVKPIASFQRRWQALRERLQVADEQTLDIGVVGGGAAGVELIQAMHYALSRDKKIAAALRFHLIQKGEGLPEGYPPAVQRGLAARLRRRHIQVHPNFTVCSVTGAGVIDQHDRLLPLQEIFWCTDAGAPAWPGESGLKTDAKGFVEVNRYLQSTSHPWVFASGDVAHLADDPRPKAGVFAVRQGPVLFQNLSRFSRQKKLRPFHPQRRFLSLLTCGDRYALASRGPVKLAGRWVWHWKDHIDRQFMRRFTQVPARSMAAPAVAGARGEDMRCNGCGAKVGADILTRVLNRLQAEPAFKLEPGSDDAVAVTLPPQSQLLQSVDFFRALIDDPYRTGRIAALHAMSDLFAVHAQPHSALAIAILPHSAAPVLERDLYQLLAGALSVLSHHNCTLIGGHTGEGAELSLGFCVNGIAAKPLMHKRGMRAGDRLILTKPLGSGMLFAAFMQGAASGDWVARALAHMEQSNAGAAGILQRHGASACTDITGFGLLGHLREMLTGSGCRVTIAIDALPLLPGAANCAVRGYRSSLHPHNQQAGELIQDREIWLRHPAYPLLFDPQTAGGLLASVPSGQVADCLATLRNAGYKDARVIGEVAATDLTPFVGLQ